MENPMNNVKPDEVNKPTSEPIAKSAGEGREPERNFKLADRTSIKLSEYKDIADLFAARAENLFKKNQERAKALGTKGWDKTSALYRHWFKTTQVVKLADKLANFYKQSDTASPAELSQAEIWEKEISNVRQELDLTREEAWDDSSAARELTDRWSGIKTPKQPSVESQAQGVITELKQAATEQDADTELAHQELKDRWAGMVAKPKKESIGKLISDISLAEGSVSKDQATLEARRDAEKIVADQLAMKKQIETARKEADRIAAEQKEQAKVDTYEKSLAGPFGWFKRLFKSKEQKATEAAAREKAELIKAGVEADTALETKWTEADEQKQDKQFKPGLLKNVDNRGLDKLDAGIVNKQARIIDRRADKQISREKVTAEKAKNAAADLENWLPEVDESVAKRSWIDKTLSKLTPSPERQGEKMMKKLEKSEAKEAAMLKKWGAEADAALKRGWTEEDERKQQESIKGKGLWKRGLDTRGNDKLEQAFINQKADAIDAKIDKNEQRAELSEGLAKGKEALIENAFAQQMATRRAKRELKSNPVPAVDSADINEAAEEYNEKVRGTVGVKPMRRPSKSGMATQVAKEQPTKWIKPV